MPLANQLTQENLDKISKIDNKELHDFISKYIELCNPANVFICDDSEEDLKYIREKTIEKKEEARLAMAGHTIHFDGFYDQGRDKAHTKFLLPEGVDLGPEIESIERQEGLMEVQEILHDMMKGREMIVKFYTLGPTDSDFTICAVQITDSFYVAHSEDLLYRRGFQEFVKLGENNKFFRFVHSAGETEEAGLGLQVSKNIEKRRMYIDLEDETVYSTNTQYGGNTIGLKKMAMRLAINRGSKEGWLTEHMLVMGVKGPENRKSYFVGAYPSMCGKTSTAMIETESIVGDDIAYLKKINNQMRAVNVEKGMFGIIDGINEDDDPTQWKALHTPHEVIFSNVLITEDGKVWWNGKDKNMPSRGVNHSGQWQLGKKTEDGTEITPSHKNARFTCELKNLENVDEKLDAPEGVEVSGVIYGGRDSNTSVPVEECFDWTHGIITKGAALESETTAATLGSEGERKFNPMSNLDFLSIPIGRYIKNNLDFAGGVEKMPKVFGVNYFLCKKDGSFCNHKNDKQVWIKWMELRTHGDVEAIKTPTGFIPKYEDLQRLFKEVLGKDYSREDYTEQFTVRVKQLIAKIDRVVQIYQTRVEDAPEIVFEVLQLQRQRLEDVRSKFGDEIEPNKLI